MKITVDKKIAKTVVEYSIKLKENENLLLHIFDDADSLANEIIVEAQKVGANVFIESEKSSLKRTWLLGASNSQIEKWYEIELEKMKKMDAYVAIRKQNNLNAFIDIPKDKLYNYNEYYGKLHLLERVLNTKWCVLIYPSDAFAQKANMSTEGFCDYYKKVCTLDYEKFTKLMIPLKERMDKTNRVRLKAKDTDLFFSIEKVKSTICDGTKNIPDGEVCMGIVKDSVNGYIKYNIPSNYQGVIFDEIEFEFEKGKIIKATSNENERLNKILDTDKGSRYIGEFAIGTNPFVEKVIYNTLFDEKMYGSLHFTPGAGGDNQSAIHWDMILCQTPEFGGGEIWFDGELIRKDGEFITDDLKHLNKAELIKELRES